MITHEKYSHAFILNVTHVLELEGGYVNDLKDPGGETKYGISRRQYPDLDIASLTYADAVKIYWRDYWYAYGCYKLPDHFSAFFFDALVNHKPLTAKHFLQCGLGVKSDGIIGPKTLSAASNVEPAPALIQMFALRGKFYSDLIEINRDLEKFHRGWLIRIFKLHQFIIKHTLEVSSL